MPTLNRKVTNHGFKEKGTSISKGSGHTLGGFKSTIAYVFRSGLNLVILVLLNKMRLILKYRGPILRVT
jgi:hypothetical protein